MKQIENFIKESIFDLDDSEILSKDQWPQEVKDLMKAIINVFNDYNSIDSIFDVMESVFGENHGKNEWCKNWAYVDPYTESSRTYSDSNSTLWVNTSPWNCLIAKRDKSIVIFLSAAKDDMGKIKQKNPGKWDWTVCMEKWEIDAYLSDYELGTDSEGNYWVLQ